MSIDRDSHIRLFLSVDVEGSSALKNSRNHNKLLRIYKDTKKSVKELLTDKLIQTDLDLDEPEGYLPSVLRSFPKEQWDWASIIIERFHEFHILFVGKLQEMGYSDPEVMARLHLWKLLGDELIYSFKIKKRKKLHLLVTAFLQVLREYDRDDVRGDFGIRLKGSGWVAGFPVRNRVVQLPAPKLYWKEDKPETKEEEEDKPKYHLHPYPKSDYLGPEMDTGFRIGKFAHPGFMVVSAELAELLGQVQLNEQLRARIVGWETLKGVWNEKPYPIIWVVPNKYPDDDYKEFLPWSESVNDLVKAWKSKEQRENAVPEIKDLGKTLQLTRDQLHNSLGIIPPYIRMNLFFYFLDVIIRLSKAWLAKMEESLEPILMILMPW